MANTKIQNLLGKYANAGYRTQLLKSGAPEVGGSKQWYATVFVYKAEPAEPISETDCKKLSWINANAGFYEFFLEDSIYSASFSEEFVGSQPAGVVVALVSKNALSKTNRLLKELAYRMKSSFHYYQEDADSVRLANQADKLYQQVLAVIRESRRMNIYGGVWFEHSLWRLGNDLATFYSHDITGFREVYIPSWTDRDALQAAFISAMAAIRPEEAWQEVK